MTKMKLLRSQYHEFDYEEFEMEILGETETEYIVKTLPIYNMDHTVTKIRKCLVGNKDKLYKIIDEPIQLYLDI